MIPSAMTAQPLVLLTPGDRAPDFDLPAADRAGRVVLAEDRRRGAVLLDMLRGLYCPFCRRHIRDACLPLVCMR